MTGADTLAEALRDLVESVTALGSNYGGYIEIDFGGSVTNVWVDDALRALAEYDAGRDER